MTTRILWMNFPFWCWKMFLVFSLFWFFFKHCGNVIKLLCIVFFMVINVWLSIPRIDLCVWVYIYFHVVFIFCRFKNPKQQSWFITTVGSLHPFSFSFKCLVWHPHSQFFVVPAFALTLQKKVQEGGSHLKVQPNASNSGRILRRSSCYLTLSQTSSAPFFSFFSCHG